MAITTNEQYQNALNRVLELLPDTDNPELELLVTAIEAYEKDRYPMPVLIVEETPNFYRPIDVLGEYVALNSEKDGDHE